MYKLREQPSQDDEDHGDIPTQSDIVENLLKETRESSNTAIEMGPTAKSILESLSRMGKEVDKCTFKDGINAGGEDRASIIHILRSEVHWLSHYGALYDELRKRIEKAQKYDSKGCIHPFFSNTGFGFVAAQSKMNRESMLSGILRRTHEEGTSLASDNEAKETDDAFLHAYATVVHMQNTFSRDDNLIAALNAFDREE